MLHRKYEYICVTVQLFFHIVIIIINALYEYTVIREIFVVKIFSWLAQTTKISEHENFPNYGILLLLLLLLL